mmetsp:Transcript_4312/g.9778  ORF Transcript_4312/g.9778 Transcript_4312/m.9778 type:complete len:256 (-) Transcript_4312:404-1171(-)|eukprot:CAMPEP_0119354582 /NCGR_PEP_ID=MMETSP1334-20130426/3565_1 /TAXON_ID=127549 /ORGANISM="Calcidiscus leptoporus, Strain RCC1130" /LENGTH=255 /DNA_ID=CAMNT_0007368175 /DNA_START=41 /DNA_END=808 /DNA_ORIENTATION=-
MPPRALETVAANTPAGLLIQIFSNVSHCMNVNVALIEEAYKTGVFSQPASGGADADEPSLPPPKKRGAGRAAKAKAEKPPRKSTDTAYLAFMRERRPLAKEENPRMKPTELMKLLASHWNSLDEEGRQAYKDQAAKTNEEKAALASAPSAQVSAEAEAEAETDESAEVAAATDASASATAPSLASRKRKQKAAAEVLEVALDEVALDDADEAVGEEAVGKQPAKADKPPLTEAERAAKRAKKKAKEAKKAAKSAP